MNELKPCPFCGADPIMETFTTAAEKVPRYRVRCPGCRIESDWDWFDPDELAKLWNTPRRNGEESEDTP